MANKPMKGGSGSKMPKQSMAAHGSQAKIKVKAAGKANPGMTKATVKATAVKAAPRQSGRADGPYAAIKVKAARKS